MTKQFLIIVGLVATILLSCVYLYQHRMHVLDEQTQWSRVALLAAKEHRRRLFAHRQYVLVDDQLGNRTELRSLPATFDDLYSEAYQFLPLSSADSMERPLRVRLKLTREKHVVGQRDLDSLDGDIVHRIYASMARTDDALDRLEFVGDDLRVALVYLCTDLDNLRDDLMSSLASVRRHVVDALVADPIVHSMDVIVFENWRRRGAAVADRWRRQVRRQMDGGGGDWLGRVRFVDASRHFPDSLPAHVARMPAHVHKDGRTCAGIEWARNYLHMCRFFVSQLWRTEPVLDEYDYWWRVDTDSTFPQPVGYNLVRAAAHRNKTFAYYNRNERESPGCLIGLYSAIERFGDAHSIAAQHRQLITNVTTYTGAFGIFRVAFFLHDSRWLALTAELDRLGGVYLHRWGEQDVFAPAFALLLPYSEIGWVSEIVMHHKGYLQPNSIGVYDNATLVHSLEIHQRL
jgi:Glycolipid 2-alpha-mannosyltransferase